MEHFKESVLGCTGLRVGRLGAASSPDWFFLQNLLPCTRKEVFDVYFSSAKRFDATPMFLVKRIIS